MKHKSAPVDNTWLSATGPVSIRMTNDYLFRALLQRSNHTLKGLICSLLHLHDNDVVSVEIVNPVELGKSVNESYLKTKPVIQIGLLNYTLFPEYPEFYANYEFRNTKNHHLYSDKLRLRVLDLSRIDLATEEDKLHRIDYWASLFKSTTWEEIKMLAKNNDYISDAASTVYRLSQEEMIRLQCEAREDYYRTQLGLAEEIDKWKTASTKYACEIEALASANKTLAAEKEKLLKIMAEHGIQPE